MQSLIRGNQVKIGLVILFRVIILAATIPAAKAAPNNACNRTQKYFAINIFVLSCKNETINHFDVSQIFGILQLTWWLSETKLTTSFPTGTVSAHRNCVTKLRSVLIC